MTLNETKEHESKKLIKVLLFIAATMQALAIAIAFMPKVFIIVDRFESKYYPSDDSEFCNLFSVFNSYKVADNKWLAVLIIVTLIASLVLIVLSATKKWGTLQLLRTIIAAIPPFGLLILCFLTLTSPDSEQSYAVDYSKGGEIIWNDAYHVNGVILGVGGIAMAVLLVVALILVIACYVIQNKTIIKGQIASDELISTDNSTPLSTRNPAPLTSSVKDEGELIESLKRLKELVDMEAITQEEFETKKSELLNH